MPEEIYIGKANQWKQQRGTRFGTESNGKDFVELRYRGPSKTAASWREQWTKGTACPEPGFRHCGLIHPPTVVEESAAFSNAVLRFEGIFGNREESQDPEIRHSTQEAHLSHYRTGAEDPTGSLYLYHRVIVTATYIKETRPTSTRFDNELNKDADPKPVANVEGSQLPGALSYTQLRLNQHYIVKPWHTILEWSKIGDVYNVVEEHSKFLQDVPGAAD